MTNIDVLNCTYLSYENTSILQNWKEKTICLKFKNKKMIRSHWTKIRPEIFALKSLASKYFQNVLAQKCSQILELSTDVSFV